MTAIGPYELNTIVCGECSQMLAALPDGCIDLTVTSPPYDSLREYRGYTFDFEPIARQLWRVTKPGGVVVWVVGDATENGSETLTSFRQALYFRELGFNVETMIYEKVNTGANGSTYFYLQSFEYSFVLSRGNPKTANHIRDRKNVAPPIVRLDPVHRRNQDGTKNHNRPVERKAFGIRTNIWRYATGKDNSTKDHFAHGHPAIFPEALARDHILSWSNPGDICLDPMIGSGTTAKQAHLLGRHYLGFDISEEYCQLARRRVANVEAQPFLMPPSVEANGKPAQPGLL